jgi:hypothetical protein
MLALAPGVAYLNEPFNPDNPRTGAGRGGFSRYFTVVTSENEDRYAIPIERMVQFRPDFGTLLRSPATPRALAGLVREVARMEHARRVGARPLMKDPIALLSAEWLADRFGMDVVVLIRHPAAFAASLKRLGWNYNFSDFLEDGNVPEVLAPYEEEIVHYAREPREILTQAALLWRILYNVVDGFRERHRDWVFLRHEDACADPVGTFERLYGRFGLELTPRARRAISRTSSSRNAVELSSPHDIRLHSAASVGRWRAHLTTDEVATLRERTEDVWPRFYTDRDW